MSASMSSVTTRGFGNGTFTGTMGLVVTMGYGVRSGVGVGVGTNPIVLVGSSKRVLTVVGSSEKQFTLYGTNR